MHARRRQKAVQLVFCGVGVIAFRCMYTYFVNSHQFGQDAQSTAPSLSLLDFGPPLRPPSVRFRSFSGRSREKNHIGYAGRTAITMFEQRGWRVTEGSDFDLLWTFAPQWRYIRKLPAGGAQRHNHCLSMPHNWGIHGTKESQAEIFRQMRARFGAVYDYFPETFILPSGLAGWKLAHASQPGVWVVKSSIGARGHGIYLVSSPASAAVPQSGVVQRYVMDPFLFRARKFHLRIYVIIANLNPLRVYWSTSIGMMMVAAEPFSLDTATFNNKRVHLTNSAQGASVFPLSSFWQHIRKLGRNTTNVNEGLRELVVKTIFGGQIQPNHSSTQSFEKRDLGSCFDLLGFDIMFDMDLKPILLEVNNGPEVWTRDPAAHPVNNNVHQNLLDEVLPILGAPRQMRPPAINTFTHTLEQFLAFSENGTTLCHGDAEQISEGLEISNNCITKSDVNMMWLAFDEERDLCQFVRIYPINDSTNNHEVQIDFFLEPETKLSLLQKRWLTFLDRTNFTIPRTRMCQKV